jgi:hypothetical protein
MKKYDNPKEEQEEKFIMSVPPSNKTQQLMNLELGRFMQKGIMINQQSFADSDFNKQSSRHNSGNVLRDSG